MKGRGYVIFNFISKLFFRFVRTELGQTYPYRSYKGYYDNDRTHEKNSNTIGLREKLRARAPI